MKKIVLGLIALATTFALAACQTAPTDNGGSTAGTQENQTSQQEQQTTEPEVTEPAVSATVQALYDAFDKAMLEQIGPLPDNYGDVKVGALIISTSNAFWANMKDCYEAAADKYGVDLTVMAASAEDDTSGQLDTLMTMADQGYDVIIVSPINGTNLIPGIVKCNENGVKVINLGPGVDVDALTEAGGHLDAKITVAFTEQGETVAKDMISRLPEGGEVAIISGLAGAGQSEGRTSGARDVFEATEGIDLVAVINCDWDASKAYDATKDLLTEHPDLKGIFACNDTMALACVEALQAEGKTGVLVYGVDYTADAQAAIKAGTMTGSMSYSSAKYTEAVLQMAIMLHEGETFDSYVYLPLTLVNVDNVNDLEGWK